MKKSALLRGFLLLGFLSAGIANPAFAHALLKDSDPPRNATLRQSPPELAIEFTEAVAIRFCGITVTDAGGQTVDKGDLHPEGREGTRLAVSLNPLKPGVYTVQWHAVSADDGHKTQGNFRFTVLGTP